MLRAFLAFAALILPVGHAAAAPLRTVALSGQVAPGTTNGETFAGFNKSQINSVGSVAFSANLAGPTVNDTNTSGVWTGEVGGLDLLFRSDAQAPNLAPGITFGRTLSHSALNRSGQLAFYDQLIGSGVTNNTDDSVWSDVSGALTMVARAGAPAPGLPPGTTYSYLWESVSFNNAGQLAYAAGIRDPGGTSPNGSGLWMDSDGVQTPIVRSGDHVAGMAPNESIISLPLSVALNQSGQIVFHAFINPYGFSSPGIFAGEPANVRLVARQGAHAAGAPEGVLFSSLDGPTQNNRGDVAFTATLSGPGIDATNNLGIWREQAGVLESIYRSDDQLPGMATDVHLSSFSLRGVMLNDAGHMAFSAYLAGPGVTSANDLSVWLRRDDALQLVAREGELASGISGGVVYSTLVESALNAAGQVAYHVELSGPGVSHAANNNYGIWATDAAGNPQLIVRTGELIEVAPGDMRTLKTVNVNLFTTNQGRPSGFNDRGQLTFSAEFTDGTRGMFISDAEAAIPGDFDRDGTVDAADLTVWKTAVAAVQFNPYADGDFDGDVDGEDMLVWQRNLGVTTTTPTVRAIPEPASIVLVVATISLVRSRRVGSGLLA
jgi:hypothetical protein